MSRRLGMGGLIGAFCLALIAITWGAVIAQVEFDRRVTIANAITQNSNLAKAFEEHTVRTIKEFDSTTLFIAHEYARLGKRIDIAGYIKQGLIDGRLFVNLGISNEHGDMFASSRIRPGPINIADREYFKVHMRPDSAGLFISKPIQSRITGDWTIPMSRRLSKPDGGFGGIVSVAVDPRYFSNFYQKAELGERGVVDLIGLDGVSRARQEGHYASVGYDYSNSNLLKEQARAPVGNFLTLGRSGIPRYVSYRTLPGFPLVITVGTSQAEVLAPYARHKKQYYVAALLVSAVIALLGTLLILVLARQQRAMSALAASDVKYRATFNQAPIGIAHSELDGRLMQVNQRLCDMLGYTRGELLSTAVADVSHPDERMLDADLEARLVAGDIPTYSAERRLLRKDGAAIWVRRTVSLVRDDAGKPLYLIRVIEDISERKQAEARQLLAATVFENALDGIFITDANHAIVAVNRAFTEVTGYSAAEAIGKHPRSLRSIDHGDAFYDAMHRTINETGNWRGEFWDRRKNGERYCELLSISVVRGARGEIRNYCAIFADITKRKLAEAQLIRLNAELEERVAARTQELERANRELDGFSYSVSHDLRAPLRAVAGFSAIVMDENRDKLDSESVGYLQRIQHGAQRMSELIEDLLDLARISRQEMHRVDFDLSALAEQAAESLAQTDPERTVHLTVRPDMHANGDPGLVRIALDNLLGNAWKFTARTAEPLIEVGQDGRDGETVFFVRDNGAGFDMRYADKLFRAFQRLHSQQEFEGTGIGLSIVQRIFDRHGGRVWAEGAVGQGATFYFVFGAH